MTEAVIVKELTEEIIENRRKFIDALKHSRNQCQASLFESWDNYDNSGRSKNFRCAVGVALTVFFGIKTEDQYLDYMDAHGHPDPYEMVAEKLGIEDDPDHEGYHDGGDVSVNDIYQMNDDGKTFRAIAQNIQERWGL